MNTSFVGSDSARPSAGRSDEPASVLDSLMMWPVLLRTMTVTHSGSRPDALAIAAVKLSMDDALTVPELSTSEEASAFIMRTTGGGGEDGGGTNGGSGEGGDCGLYIGGFGGGEGDGGSEGGGCGGEGGGRGSSPAGISMMGAASTVILRAELAASAERRELLSAADMEEMVRPASTTMVTVMRTLAASTVMLTASRLAPTTLAICCCRAEVSE